MTEPSDPTPARATGDPLAPGVGDESPGEREVRERVESLYHQYGEELSRFVLGVVRDPDLAAEAVQSALCRALERGHTARVETFKAWLFRVAFHEALLIRRQRQAGQKASRRLADWLRINHDPDSSAGAASLNGLIRVETAETVRRLLDHLPDEQRRVVLARIHDDKTFAQIAAELNVPLGTVLTRMRLALEKLRKALPQH